MATASYRNLDEYLTPEEKAELALHKQKKEKIRQAILSNIKANYNLVDKGYYNLHIDVSEISEIITNNQILFDQSYLHKILKKYYF